MSRGCSQRISSFGASERRRIFPQPAGAHYMINSSFDLGTPSFVIDSTRAPNRWRTFAVADLVLDLSPNDDVPLQDHIFLTPVSGQLCSAGSIACSTFSQHRLSDCAYRSSRIENRMSVRLERGTAGALGHCPPRLHPTPRSITTPAPVSSWQGGRSAAGTLVAREADATSGGSSATLSGPG